MGSAEDARVAHTRRRSEDPDGFPRRIDVTRFREVGRINRPSGATSWEDYDARIAVLDELHYDGNVDLLRELQSGKIKMSDLMILKRQRRLDVGVGSLRLAEPLLDAFDRVLPQLGGKKKTRDNYKTLFCRLVKSAVPAITDRSAVRELERIDWKKTALKWAADGRGQSGQVWNNMLIALSAFLTELLGDVDNPDRRRIMARIPRAGATPGRVPDVRIDQVVEVIHSMPRNTGPTALTLLLTGLRSEELRGAGPSALRPNLEAIAIAKSGTRRRVVTPFDSRLKNVQSEGLVYVPDGFWRIAELAVRQPPSYNTLRRHWCQRCHDVGIGQVTRIGDGPQYRWPQMFLYTGMRLHDLRHCYAQWVHGAGMPLSQLRHALRHGDESSTARYAQQAAKREAADLAGQAIGGAFDPSELWPDEASE